MNRPELYKNTVDLLFDAYFADELVHNLCCACAVGNICKAPAKALGINNGAWSALFCTDSSSRMQEPGRFAMFFPKEVAIRLVEATGYSIKELARIEYAFETASEGNSEEDWMYNGLVAVLDVLKEIHQVPDDTQEQQRFKQHYQSLTA